MYSFLSARHIYVQGAWFCIQGKTVLLHQLTLEEFYEAWGAKVKEETAGILTYVKVDDAEFCFPSNIKNSRVSWGSNVTDYIVLE